jgi:hypothetical protein
MRLVFRLPDLSGYDYFITWRGGSRLWLPDTAPELALLKPELRFEVQEALRLGDTCLERLAAVSPRYWRELYSASLFAECGEPPEPRDGSVAMWYPDQDLAVVAARHLTARGFRVLLEVPELTTAQAALLAGCDVTVCVAASSRGLEAADAVAREPRAAARAALRSINLLGGAWDERTQPTLDLSTELAAFEEYSQGLPELRPPEPRKMTVEMLAWAFGKELFAQAAEVLGEVASASLPLRSLPDLGVYWRVLERLLLYGYVAVERDVLRATEKGVFAALQVGVLAFRGGGVGGEGGEEGGEEGAL